MERKSCIIVYSRLLLTTLKSFPRQCVVDTRENILLTGGQQLPERCANSDLLPVVRMVSIGVCTLIARRSCWDGKVRGMRA